MSKKVDGWFAKSDAKKEGKLSLAEATAYIKKELEIDEGNTVIEDTFQEMGKGKNHYLTKEDIVNFMKEA